jgi:hypothetical protein
MPCGAGRGRAVAPGGHRCWRRTHGRRPRLTGSGLAAIGAPARRLPRFRRGCLVAPGAPGRRGNGSRFSRFSRCGRRASAAASPQRARSAQSPRRRARPPGRPQRHALSSALGGTAQQRAPHHRLPEEVEAATPRRQSGGGGRAGQLGRGLHRRGQQPWLRRRQLLLVVLPAAAVGRLAQRCSQPRRQLNGQRLVRWKWHHQPRSVRSTSEPAPRSAAS